MQSTEMESARAQFICSSFQDLQLAMQQCRCTGQMPVWVSLHSFKDSQSESSCKRVNVNGYEQEEALPCMGSCFVGIMGGGYVAAVKMGSRQCCCWGCCRDGSSHWCLLRHCHQEGQTSQVCDDIHGVILVEQAQQLSAALGSLLGLAGSLCCGAATLG